MLVRLFDPTSSYWFNGSVENFFQRFPGTDAPFYKMCAAARPFVQFGILSLADDEAVAEFRKNLDSLTKPNRFTTSWLFSIKLPTTQRGCVHDAICACNPANRCGAEW
ncbi:MAG: hypothetical protein KBF37_11140 [Saprospiraceae bacterium]|jgi:hypothetical protein|nr:hypothetical protein [Saprospiraceae bacterium]MBV6472216.1 hypothetical protein [Saprospiraceae bacterium]